MGRLRPGLLVTLVVAATVAGAALAPSASQAALPAGFSDDLVAAVPSPTALAFTPDVACW